MCHDLVKNGVATFSSFILFGGVPLYVYLIGYAWSAESRDEIARPDDENVVYACACAISLISLFFVGACAAFLVKQPLRKVVSNGLFTLLNGAVAGSVSYLVGFAFEQALLKA
eukprot:g7037.t1